jgi:hypothetical protein
MYPNQGWTWIWVEKRVMISLLSSQLVIRRSILIQIHPQTVVGIPLYGYRLSNPRRADEGAAGDVGYRPRVKMVVILMLPFSCLSLDIKSKAPAQNENLSKR